MKGSVTDDPLVTHLREDGLTWRPKRTVDWLVCDIVLQPIRIAELVARWIADGAARRAIFNLKLPMKKRYEEVKRCEARMLEITDRAGTRAELRIRQFYHDREEVTGYLARRD
jgi:23S rRNA (cytidine2498-2'-O)-methyltransferase